MIKKNGFLFLVLLLLKGYFAISLSANEGLQKIDFPEFRLIVIQDTFIPLSSDLYQGGDIKIRDSLATKGIFNLTVNVFLIQKDDHNILIDTGNGGTSGKFLSKLSALNIKPEKIDAVLITHFHSDHIGGLIDQSGRAVFSRATVYLSEVELNACLKKKYKKDTLESKIFREYKGQIQSFPFDKTLPVGIIGRKGSGHTIGHTCYELGNYQFLGDLMHISSLQFSWPNFCAVFDYDKKEAVQMRVKFITEAWNQKTTLIGAHFPFPGIGHVEKEGELFRYVPNK